MKSPGICSFLFLAVFGVSTPASRAIDALLEADTFARPDGAEAKGAAATLRADGAAAIYLRFGFEGVLPGGTTAAQIGKATLRVYDRSPFLYSFPEILPGIAVVPVLQAWHEHGLTSANAPTTADPVKLFQFGGRNGGFLDIDLTDLVREWISGARANHGIALRGARPEDQPRQFPWTASRLAIDSKENTATAHEARLQIVLLPAPQPN